MSLRCSIHNKSYWYITSPNGTIELYNDIIELQEINALSQNIISKIKGNKMIKKKEHF